ncbi:hypothetical protein PPSIR1_29825 [Plesiocystis pacifica SIR-1]|uniref:Uncharacterized protein n=1 Tax=Plesiocystis pacifica SIR-1 TaxID=391625 RepID=A6FYU4_9BACT|nr:hypothetical protein [Plesiocystis pacifica]EDM81099.1 hypothetical protein PPSIR1_29825 [Plesiocystis pacifica SIR-1]
MIARLDFHLPRFRRWLWVSAEARAHWEPRLASLAAGLETLALEAVASKAGAARLVDPTPAEVSALRERARAHGLVALRMPRREDLAPHVQNPTLLTRADADVPGSWHRGDLDAVLAALGLPPCCAAAWRRTHVEARWRDGAWGTHGELQGEVEGPALLNRMLAPIGVHACAHDPCGPRCEASVDRARGRLDRAPAELAEHLEQVLDWPMEWNALHGVVELRTPVVKLSWDTDPCASAVVRRRPGRVMPEHAAVGQRFPYRDPNHHKLLHSVGWRRGLAHAEASGESP